MLVLLREDLKGYGKTGEVVKVKDGYARNYLIPKKMAYPATDAYMNVLKEENKAQTIRDRKVLAEANNVKTQLEGKVFTIKVKVGEEDRLFGSVTSQDICDAVIGSGINIEKKRIELPETIKTLGEYSVKYKMHSQVEINISVKVEKE